MTNSVVGARAMLAQTVPRPYWWEDPARPEQLPGLAEATQSDLVVVGGGYLGLWTALLAADRQPGRDIVILEAAACGHAASGRNGGFCEATLTHGFGNGVARWPEEIDQLERLGVQNLDAIESTVADLGIDCDFVRSGALAVATRMHELPGLRAEYDERRSHRHPVEWLCSDDLRGRVDSPTFLGGFHDPDSAILEPARLAWGLREACLAAGVRIFEGTPATAVAADGTGVRITTEQGSVTARHAVLATNAFPPLLRRLRLMTVPVYDYALMTAPLTQEQRASIGWYGREGIADSGNRFHYFRTTRDGRILWGGYDAIYHYASGIDEAHDLRRATFEALADNFARTFPTLAEVPFTHAWGGVIDTCTRFTAFYGTALKSRVGYALGFTGLGVAATRFAGEVVLDLLSGQSTERTELAMVRERPLPFPPEPVRWAGIEATRRSLARADDRGGQENLWLRGLGRLGLGFDS